MCFPPCRENIIDAYAYEKLDMFIYEKGNTTQGLNTA